MLHSIEERRRKWNLLLLGQALFNTTRCLRRRDYSQHRLRSGDSRNKTRPVKVVVVANSKQKVFSWTQLVVKYTSKNFGYDYTLYWRNTKQSKRKPLPSFGWALMERKTWVCLRLSERCVCTKDTVMYPEPRHSTDFHWNVTGFT